ncbi:hypothetical protein JCM10213_000327 [Rhodosporidiobolus nylandii]
MPRRCLTQLPAELFDRNFALIPREKRPQAICTAVLSTQRQHYRSFGIPDIAYLPHITDILPVLRNLEIISVYPSPQLAAILHLLPEPTKLSTLVVTSGPSGFENALASALPAFPSLHTLELDCAVDLSHPELVATLRTVPLRRFVLGPNAVFSLVPLRALVVSEAGSPRPLSQLKIFELHTAEAMAGLTCDGYFRARPGFPFGEDWILPDWPAHFSSQDFDDVLHDADEVVDLGGSAMDAHLIQEEYEGERAEFEGRQRRLRDSNGPRACHVLFGWEYEPADQLEWERDQLWLKRYSR